MDRARIEAEYRLHFDNIGSVICFAEHIAKIARNEAMEDAVTAAQGSVSTLEGYDSVTLECAKDAIRDLKDKELK